MKKVFTIFCILLLSKSISQTPKEDFEINYKIEKQTEDKSLVQISIKNINGKPLYISTNKDFSDIEAEKRAFYDMGYSWIPFPDDTDETLFFFVKLENGEVYNDQRVVTAKNAEKLIVNFEYLPYAKELIETKDSKSEYTIKRKDYLEFADKEKINYKSQIFNL
jgi:hypothetical protein